MKVTTKMSETSKRIPVANRRRLHSDQISELVVIDADGSNRKVIYEVAELIEAPNWTVDGKWLIFNADGRLFRISPDGRQGPERIDTAPIENANNDHCLAPDGKSIYISSRDRHIYKVSLDGGTPERITHDQPPEREYIYYLHGVSPDGNTLAYVGYEAGRTLTRIATIPATGGRSPSSPTAPASSTARSIRPTAAGSTSTRKRPPSGRATCRSSASAPTAPDRSRSPTTSG